MSCGQDWLWGRGLPLLLLALCVSGCAKPEPIPTLDEAFHGTWRNSVSAYYNWWELTADGAINYGISIGAKACDRREATITSPSSIDIHFGMGALVELSIVEDQLVFVGERGSRATHVRVDPTSICKTSIGTFRGAPYPER